MNHAKIAIALLVIASSAAQARTFAAPHVFEATGSVSSSTAVSSPTTQACSPRDSATGQASGKVVTGYDLKSNKAARCAAPGGDNSPPAQGHNYIGTVTIVK